MRSSVVLDLHGVRTRLVRGSIVVILLLLLLTLMSVPVFAHSQNQQDSHSQTIASVQSASSGRADLKWDAHGSVLVVVLIVNGLPSDSSHAAHIHAGTCSSIGRILYSLPNVVSNKAGHVVARATIKDVKNAIPPKGWLVAIHKGSSAKTSTILCGNVANPHKAASVTVPLSALPMH